MNYRNFFDITSLVGVRVEDPEVVDATHVLVDSLLDRGDVGGVRVDHVDGLRQPRGYLERMRARAGPRPPGTPTTSRRSPGRPSSR